MSALFDNVYNLHTHPVELLSLLECSIFACLFMCFFVIKVLLTNQPTNITIFSVEYLIQKWFTGSGRDERMFGSKSRKCINVFLLRQRQLCLECSYIWQQKSHVVCIWGKGYLLRDSLCQVLPQCVGVLSVSEYLFLFFFSISVFMYMCIKSVCLHLTSLLSTYLYLHIYVCMKGF